MNNQTYWQCAAEECKDKKVYHHKGLCRLCTKYDKSGVIKTPVQRVRINEDGSPFTPHICGPTCSIHAGLGLVTRKQQKEMSQQIKAEKKQKVAMRRAKRLMRDNPIPPEHQEPLDEMVMEIGESIPEQEEEE